jgi:hypothetical protein
MANNYIHRYEGTASGKNQVHIPETANATLVTLTDTQTMTNKTFTSPTLNTPTLTTPSVTGGTATNTTMVTPIHTLSVQILAAAGNDITNAGAINATSGGFIHVTDADANKGVKLPVAAAGMYYHVKNSDAANAVLKVYPQVNSTINAISANGSLDMAAKTAATLVALNTTAWYSISLLPS